MMKHPSPANEVLEYETPPQYVGDKSSLAAPARQIVKGAGLLVFCLVLGDLSFWNEGLIGFLIAPAMLLVGNVLIFRGTHSIAKEPDDRAHTPQNVIRICLPLGLANLDALIFYLILDSPLTADWARLLIGITACAVLVGSIAHISHLARLAQSQALRIAFRCVGVVFPFLYLAYVVLILTNGLMCRRLDATLGKSMGGAYFTEGFTNYEAYARPLAFAAFFSGLIYLFLIELLGKQPQSVTTSAGPLPNQTSS